MNVRATLRILMVLGGLLSARAGLVATDCNANGVEDFADVVSGAARDCNENGVPDDCDISSVNLGFHVENGNRLDQGSLTFGLVVEDFDNDGHLDLGVGIDAANSPQSISYFHLWAGSRSGFVSRPPLPLPTFPFNLDAADFDKDGFFDVAAAGFGDSVDLLRNHGGRFEVERTIPAPGAADVAPADFDEDGDLDVAVAGGGRVTVLKGQGGFQFAAAQSLIVGAEPIRVMAGDFNGDARLDIVTANSHHNVSVITNVDGTSFAEPRNFAAGNEPEGLAAGDLDADGDLDVVVSGSEAVILLNPGNGRLEGRIPIRGLDVYSSGVTIADLDADGDLDIVTGLDQIYLVLNHGGGNFARARSAGFTFGGLSIVAEDVTGDGELDLIATRHSDIHILTRTLIANSGDCDTDAIPDECELENNDCNENRVPDNCDLAVGGGSNDCNLDQIPDECESDCNQNRREDSCDIAHGRSKDCNANGRPDECDVAAPSFGGMEDSRSFSAGRHITAVATIDPAADGRPDVVAAIGSDLVLFGNTAADLLGGPTVLLEDVAPGSATTGDYDGDGIEDLAVATTKDAAIAVLSGRGSAFTPLARVTLPAASGSMETTDIDGDGTLDILFAPGNLEEIWNLTHAVEGGFRRGPTIVSQDTPAFLRARDLDHDGDPDIVGTGPNFPGFSVIENHEWGRSFTSSRQLDEADPTSFDFADIDHDGYEDIVSLTRSGFIELFQNSGTGEFQLSNDFLGFDDDFLALDVGDFDDDLLADVAIIGRDFIREPSGVLKIIFGDNDPTSVTTSSETLGTIGSPSILQADMDQDGQVDVVAAFGCSDCGGPFERFLEVFLNATAPVTSRDFNHDRVPDECQGALFHRGDSNQDGLLDLADAVATLLYLYRGAEPPSCMESADFDNDGSVVLTDPILVLNHLFQSGSPPAAPGPPSFPCGRDPDAQDSPGALGCDTYTGCR